MKRKTLEKLLRKAGWYLLRHGSDHDIWIKGPIERRAKCVLLIK